MNEKQNTSSNSMRNGALLSDMRSVSVTSPTANIYNEFSFNTIKIELNPSKEHKENVSPIKSPLLIDSHGFTSHIRPKSAYMNKTAQSELYQNPSLNLCYPGITIKKSNPD